MSENLVSGKKISMKSGKIEDYDTEKTT